MLHTYILVYTITPVAYCGRQRTHYTHWNVVLCYEFQGSMSVQN